MHISTGEPQVSIIEMPSPPSVSETPCEMAKWLRQELELSGVPGHAQAEPVDRVAWGERTVIQSERWQVAFTSPHETTTAEYWMGNGYGR